MNHNKKFEVLDSRHKWIVKLICLVKFEHIGCIDQDLDGHIRIDACFGKY